MTKTVMDLDQDEVFGSSRCDGDLSSTNFRFRHAEEDPRSDPVVGSICRGTVRSVKDFGAFVRLASLDRDGMVHVSQMFKNSHDKSFKPSDVVSVGDNVFVKVIAVEPSTGKISLSIKYVNQTTGQDLDQNGVELDRENQKRKEAPRRQEKSSALGAILNVTCTKCGGHGHLSSECFGAGKKYDLLPEDDGNLLVGVTNGTLPFMDHKFSAPPSRSDGKSPCISSHSSHQHRRKHSHEPRSHDRVSDASCHESSQQASAHHHRHHEKHRSHDKHLDRHHKHGTGHMDRRSKHDSENSWQRDSERCRDFVHRRGDGHSLDGHRGDDGRGRVDAHTLDDAVIRGDGQSQQNRDFGTREHKKHRKE